MLISYPTPFTNDLLFFMRPTPEARFRKLLLAYVKQVQIRYSVDPQTEKALAGLINQIEQQESKTHPKE